jgi:hypothetical protein
MPKLVQAEGDSKPDLDIEIKPSGPNNVFVAGETVRFPVHVKSNVGEPRTAILKLSLLDYFGKTTELPTKTVYVEPGTGSDLVFDRSSGQTGYFTPVARVGDVEKRGLPVAIVPKPAPGPKPLSIFGISGPLSRNRRDWELLRLMGVKWIRGDMAWPHFQQKRDEWRGGYDDAMKFARETQIGVMATVGYTQNFAAQEFEWSADFGPPPRWVAARHTAPVRPDCLRDWEQYCARLVKAYGDVVRYWEIWNEADLSFYYGTPGEYMAMHKAAWCAMKKADPNAPILGGNSCICPYFIQRVIPDGFFAYTDVMSVHYPFSFDTPIEWNRPVAGYARPYLEKTGYRKALDMTEGGNLIYQGRGEPFGIDNDSHKTRILVKEHMFNCRQQQGKFYQFTFQGSLGWGFMPPDASYPYAHFVSHAVMASVLEDADYVGHLDLGPDVSAFVFSRNMQPITVLWKGSYIVPAGECDVEFEAGAPQVTRVDLMGGQTVMKKHRSYKLHLDQDPIYILGGDNRLLARALAERVKPVLDDLRRLAGKVKAEEVGRFVENASLAAVRQSELLGQLQYQASAEQFRSPLESQELERLLEAAHTRGLPIPAYNLYFRLCDLAEVLWLQMAVAGGGQRSSPNARMLTEAGSRLTTVEADIRKTWATASQPRVSDMFLRAKQVLALAQRSADANQGSLDPLAIGRIGFVNSLLDAASMLAAFEKKVVRDVYLSLDLPTSVHWGGRWEKKLLVKPLGDTLTFPAKSTVHNRLSDSAAKGVLRLGVPEGWSVRPEAVPYEVPADQDKDYEFQVTIPADNPFVPYEDSLRLHGELAGDALFSSTQQIEIVPPLWTEVLLAGSKSVEVRSSDQVMDITGAKVAVVGDSGKIGQTDVTVVLRNRDRRPWSGKVRLCLPPGWACQPAEIAFGNIDHYRKAEAQFAVYYPSDVKLGPGYPILAKAFSAEGKLIGMGVTGTGGDWKFKLGTDPKWQEKDFDDSGWQAHALEYHTQQGYVGDAWFRQRVFIPETWGKEAILLNLGIPCMAIEVFFNGHKVGQLGQWPPEWCACWGDIANFVVNRDFVQPGNWNTVAVCVFIPYSMGGITPGFLLPVR